MPAYSTAAIMDFDPAVWQRELALSDDDLPVAIVSEGSWWRAQRTKWRLSYLDDVRELAFPDIFWGRWRGRPLLYCCAYGAARAVEIAHLGGCLGARIAVQIGTCGALQSGLATGEVILPEPATGRENIARHYGGDETAAPDRALTMQASEELQARGLKVHTGPHLTWPSIFAQSTQMVRGWRDEGFLSVDMETATTFAVSRHFGVAATAMLAVWDELLNERSFLDPLSEDEMRRLDEANGAVYEVALDLVASC